MMETLFRVVTWTLALLSGFSAVVSAEDDLPFECYGFEQTEGSDRSEKTKVILHGVEVNGFRPAILSHTGGGPNGSHFNFSGLREGLLCVLKVPVPAQEISRIEIKVGRRKIRDAAGKTALPDGGTLVSAEVPFETVERASRKIRPADLGRLYHDKLGVIAAYQATGQWEGVAAPNEGQCIDFALVAHTRDGKIFRGDGLAHVNCCGE